MTFTQILVLCIVICLTVVQIVNMVTAADVRKAPGKEALVETVVASLVQADDTKATVLIQFKNWVTDITYVPAKGDGGAVQDGDKH